MRRSSDFPGVVTCTPQDSLANLFQLIRKRRLHRLVVVAGEEGYEGRKKGSLVGIISLSDVMGYVISEDGVGKAGAGDGGSVGFARRHKEGVLKEEVDDKVTSTTPPFPPPIPLPEVDASMEF